MQNKLIGILIGAVLMVGIGTLVYSSKNPTTLPLGNTLNTTQPSNSVNTGANTVRKTEVDDEEEGGSVASPVVTPPTTTQTTPKTTTTAGGITLAQIAQHNFRSSCWSAVNGGVYDLTSWIPNHPGGEQNILSMCGVDGSAGYNGQHGGRSKPATILGGFKIGTLTK